MDANTELKKEATKEANRIKKKLQEAGISDLKMEMLEPVIINTSWMKAKLDDARQQIKGSSVAIPYNNGGNQKGIRENPLFKGYEALWKSYMQGIKILLEQLPQEAAEVKEEELERPKTMLEIVRERHRA